MGFIEKFKIHYYSKIITDLIKSQKFKELDQELSKIYQNSPLIYYQILKVFYFSFKEVNNTHSLFSGNLIFINSYLVEDIDLISNFLNFYLNEINFENKNIFHINDEIAKIEKEINQSNFLSFEKLIENSIYYQAIISIRHKKFVNILKNQFAFFSTSKDFNFSDPNLTKCFFLLVDHPYIIYQKIKESNNDNKVLSQNIMFNLDNTTFQQSHLGIEIEIINKGWTTHTASWIDPAVLNSFKGLVIQKADLINSPLDTYLSIIMHLRQSGWELDLNYSVIEKYIGLNKLSNTLIKISNNEKKFIQKNIEKVTSDLNFEL